MQTIRIAGPMLAADLGVKVYDAQLAKRVSFIERPPGAPPPELFRCHLRWQSPVELIIGCADTIKIGRVREREPLPTVNALGGGPMGVAGAAMPPAGPVQKYMEIVTLIQTDFYIGGLAGVQLRVEKGVIQHDLLVLAYVCEPRMRTNTARAATLQMERSGRRCVSHDRMTSGLCGRAVARRL